MIPHVNRQWPEGICLEAMPVTAIVEGFCCVIDMECSRCMHADRQTMVAIMDIDQLLP